MLPFACPASLDPHNEARGWRRMKNIKWIHKVKNKEVLDRVKE